jgi:hypothetical protein
MLCLGFRVQDSGCRVQVRGLGFRVHRIQGSECMRLKTKLMCTVQASLFIASLPHRDSREGVDSRGGRDRDRVTRHAYLRLPTNLFPKP